MEHLNDVYFSNFNAVCNVGGHYTPPVGANWSLAPKTFSQCKFYLVASGSCDISINDQSFVGKKGDWFLMPCGAKNSYQNHRDKPFELYWMHFDVYPNAELFSISELPYRVKVEDGGKAWELFRRYAEISESKNLIDLINIKIILLELIAEYLKLANINDVSIKGTEDSRVDAILRYINENLSQGLSVIQAASHFHMHPNHFIRFFKSKTGQTPAKYIKAKQMEKAKRYLEETEMSVKEIMASVGETDPYSFSKQFKNAYSFSPVNYRKYFKNSKK
ncbi:MAG: helix-turn-helix domain-containing protein [Clostridia bacterium]|nr:helix-turn-helix domain-containing protein [Clostridia bacterium]